MPVLHNGSRLCISPNLDPASAQPFPRLARLFGMGHAPHVLANSRPIAKSHTTRGYEALEPLYSDAYRSVGWSGFKRVGYREGGGDHR
jgi:hypothetical protein